MLVLRVEIWPGGDQDRAHEIARVGIANTTCLRSISDYSVVHIDDIGTVSRARVNRHQRALGWLPLAARALAALGSSAQAAVPDGDDITTALRRRP